MNVPDRSRAVLGFRRFGLALWDEDIEILSLIVDRAVSSKPRSWNQETLEATARCGNHNPSPNHHPPSSKCQCGLYAHGTYISAISPYRRPHIKHRITLVGVVAGWGKILRWSRGFKAEHMMVLAFFLPAVRANADEARRITQHFKELDIPLLTDHAAFRNEDYARGWAAEHECELYMDTIRGEPAHGSLETKEGGHT